MGKIIFSSKSCEYETPNDFFSKLNQKYNFTLDVCASAENAKCADFYSIENNGLSQKWHGRCWMNPPYGREIGKWMRKAYESVQHGDCEMVCCLVPSRTDTAWWHDYAMKGRIEFVRGKLKFSNSKDPAPFASSLVYFEKDDRAK